MIVVSDTSPINNLAAIGQLLLLRQLYETVVIPEAVYRELLGPPKEAGAVEVETYEWIQIKSVANRTVVESLLTESVHIGECEAIALALELGVKQVLIDDRAARIVAEGQGLKFTGVIGILVEAKDRGLITAIRPLLDTLRSPVGFWIAEPLYQKILRVVGEL